VALSTLVTFTQSWFTQLVQLPLGDSCQLVLASIYKHVQVPNKHTIHSPELDLPIISSRDQQGEGGVEGDPVHTTVMALCT